MARAASWEHSCFGLRVDSGRDPGPIGPIRDSLSILPPRWPPADRQGSCPRLLRSGPPAPTLHVAVQGRARDTVLTKGCPKYRPFDRPVRFSRPWTIQVGTWRALQSPFLPAWAPCALCP